MSGQRSRVNRLEVAAGMGRANWLRQAGILERVCLEVLSARACLEHTPALRCIVADFRGAYRVDAPEGHWNRAGDLALRQLREVLDRDAFVELVARMKAL